MFSDARAKISAIDKSVAVIEFKLDGTILTANKNFLETMGYSLSETKGKHHRMFVGEEYARSSQYTQFWERLRGGEFISDKFKRLGKNGKEVWIQATYNPIFDIFGRPYKVVKFATDITDQVHEYADFRGQIEAINKVQAVIHFDLNGTILAANQTFLSAMGYSFEEIKGKHHSMFVAEDFVSSQEYHDFWQGLRSGEFKSGVFKRQGKGGKDIWIRASYNPIYDLDGKPFKVVKFATDITEIIKLTEVTNKNVQTVASATEEMASSISEISRNMSLSQSSMNNILSITSSSGVASSMLAEKAKAMEGIVTIIRGIAGQVNLLSLNATIEAARAGEFGKGFAVVASEVKTLANQTAISTQQIAEEILAIQEISGTVAESVNSIIEAADSVNHYVGTIAGSIEEQSAVTREISANSQSVSKAVNEIDGCIRRI
ncbi:MAG: PAS domain-containing methyl-accepting chemotaxis protein [Pseudobdellovibrionaceae bacterium]|nr:PAS domain-containing methyl-accepting chemotaxis protein [Pseudobdellovibrionaceae bacterium]